MDKIQFVKWTVNQYLTVIEHFKKNIYKSNPNFLPSLVQGQWLAEAIKLSAQINDYPLEWSIEEIENTLFRLYEPVFEAWNKEDHSFLNVYYCLVDTLEFPQCFFIELLLVEHLLWNAGQTQEISQVRKYLIEIPLEAEGKIKKGRHKIEITQCQQQLIRILHTYKDYFFPISYGLGMEYCMDYMLVYLFYERCFYCYKCSENPMDGIE